METPKNAALGMLPKRKDNLLPSLKSELSTNEEQALPESENRKSEQTEYENKTEENDGDNKAKAPRY
jgi:hypothetical protein